jgi:cytochrome c
MKNIIVSLAAATLLISGSAMAIDMPVDGKAKCGTCHKIDQKSLGPSWKDIAAKYKGKEDAEKTLIANITNGGKFDWSQGYMPPRGLGASDVQIAALAKFIAIDLNK